QGPPAGNRDSAHFFDNTSRCCCFGRSGCRKQGRFRNSWEVAQQQGMPCLYFPAILPIQCISPATNIARQAGWLFDLGTGCFPMTRRLLCFSSHKKQQNPLCIFYTLRSGVNSPGIAEEVSASPVEPFGVVR